AGNGVKAKRPHPVSISPVTSNVRFTPPMVKVALAGNVPDGSLPLSAALRTACSISRCDVTPTFFKNLRTLMLKVSSFMGLSSCARVRAFAVTDQRKMAERRHRAPFDEADARCAILPRGEPSPGKLGAPAEPARDWCKGKFAEFPQPALSADVIDQHDL